MDKKSQNHYVGCLLGGAAGDALGAPVEFLSLSEIRKIYGKKGIVEYPDNHGRFTDDTQMTLFTAEGLLRSCSKYPMKGIGSALSHFVFHSYHRWLLTQGYSSGNPELKSCAINSGWLINQDVLHQKRAPGVTCISALVSGTMGTVEKPINNSKGCGALMRSAPVGMILYGDPEQAFKVACEVSAITHGHPAGYLSAGFFAAVISELAVKRNLTEAVSIVIPILKKWPYHDETLKAVYSAVSLCNKLESDHEQIQPEDVETLGRGWIAEEALGIALFASLIYEQNYERGVHLAVNHSGDSDSTGSLTGNMLGLINGVDSIPEKWIRNLEGNEIVANVGNDLYSMVKDDAFNSSDEWWDKYPGY
jgi:ADP-ribosylglycohydrolase